MAKKKINKTRAEQISDLKRQIISNSKDAEWSKKMLSQLLALYRMECNEPAELVVPVKEVTERIDCGAFAFISTPRGILFQTKGGLSTFVESRMIKVYTMLKQAMDIQKEKPDYLDEKLAQSFIDAVAYIMQTPIFASINEEILFSIAANVLNEFNNFCDKNYTNAEVKPETDEDIQDNIAFDNFNEAMNTLAEETEPQVD